MKLVFLSIFSLVISASVVPDIAKASDLLIPNGPLINIKTPFNKIFDGPINLHINFQSHTPEQVIDMASLRVKYLKFLDLDITEKIRPYIKENSIVIQKMDLPEGNHRIKIKICDFQNNESIKIIRIQVRQERVDDL